MDIIVRTDTYDTSAIIGNETVTNACTTNRDFDYGFDSTGIFQVSADYKYSDPKPCKTIILVNPLDCENNITVSDLASKWSGTGHLAWEYLLSDWFVRTVVYAIETNKQEINITHVFNKDLYTLSGRKFSMEAIFNHLMPSFEIVEESAAELRVRFKI